MIKKYICLVAVVIFSMIATNYSQAIEIKETYKLKPQDAEIQSNFNTEKITGTKGGFELEGSWLIPSDTIFASNGNILYNINIHDAKFYDRFIWDYFIPVLSPVTGMPTGAYDTLFMFYRVHFPPHLTYMPPDSSNSDRRYWQPYWRFWSLPEGQEDYFNSDSCWSFGVGFSFLDMNIDYRDPGVWKTKVNMTTKTAPNPVLLCDTMFYVIDNIPPKAYIMNIQDSGYVGDTHTIQVSGWDNAKVVKRELYIDDVLVSSFAGGALEYLWTVPQDEEIHVLQAKAYDVYNPPLQLGLYGISKPIHVSRTNVQATEIVAQFNVKLDTYQNDTIFKGHFASLNNFIVDTNIPLGVTVDFQKQLQFVLSMNIECYNFGQPSTWKPVCKYSVDISEFGGTEAKGEFIGWNGNIIINKALKHISIKKTFGIHELTLKLTFEDQSGNLISEQQIVMPCWVFFDKYGGSVAPKYFADLDNDGAPNWFEYWADLPELYKNSPYETFEAKYDPTLPDITYGIFWNNTPRYYFIGPIVGYNTGIILTDRYPNMSGYWKENFKGIHAFTVICRHENLHQTQFETWWGSYREYVLRQPDEDFDRDGVPLNVEILFGTSPIIKDTDDDGLSDSDEIIASYHKTWYEDIVDGKPFDLIDWSNPGKQTYPQE